MRIVGVSIAVFALVGCASNPLQHAQFWSIDQCVSAPSAQIQFKTKDGSTLATVPRANCLAVAAAARKIEAVAGYHADRILIASIEDLNAFATLDKSNKPVIVVTVGMLTTLGSDEAAWAGLLGHEIAHHIRHHGQGRAEAKTGAQQTGQAAGNLIAQLIPGVGGFIAGNAANFAATNAIYGAYTRPQESEADELGLRWMAASGYDPKGMERLFDELAKDRPGLPTFLSTHPGAEDRAQMVRRFIATGK